jgi:GntR family transcriptional regulator, carbon starvation induced regulator
VSAVRKALSCLAVEGLVVAAAQKGFSVTPISAEEIKGLTKTIAIERLCLADSLKQSDVEWESQIIALFHRLSRTPYKDPHGSEIANPAWIKAHVEFHAALTAACNSPSLLKIWRSLYVRALPAISGLVDIAQRDVNAEHRGLMEAALARDEALIVERIAWHFTTTMDVILKVDPSINIGLLTPPRSDVGGAELRVKPCRRASEVSGRSRTSTRQSGSIRTLSLPTTTEASPTAARAITTRRSPT